jgi:hypothetical protein
LAALTDANVAVRGTYSCHNKEHKILSCSSAGSANVNLGFAFDCDEACQLTSRYMVDGEKNLSIDVRIHVSLFWRVANINLVTLVISDFSKFALY